MPADVAEGVANGAFSVAPLFDRASWDLVAELRLRVNPGEFGRMMCVLGEYYGWALAAPEMNNHGFASIEAMHAWKGKGYPHILLTTDLWPDATEKEGFPTSEATKTSAITSLRNLVEDMGYYERSPVAIEEMRHAVFNEEGKVVSERAASKHGLEKKKLHLDCVTTRWIMAYCMRHVGLDTTYREPEGSRSPIVVTSIVPPPGRGRTGYR